MSFYANNKSSSCCPGPVNGNPLNGLCERVCIQTTKVFDSGMKQITETGIPITVTFTNTPTPPLTYVGTVNDPNNTTTITNLVVERLADKPNYARVSGTANIPLLVTATDATGNTYTGTSSTPVNFDTLLFVPQPAIIPYNIQAFGAVSSTIGTWISENNFIIDLCITLILRVVVEAELCIPSYGYCQIPPSIDFVQDPCTGVFDLPLFPTATN